MEAPKRPGSGRPAPYGQACVGCVKAKCKCIYRGDGSCERCSRRGVECLHSEGVRKRTSRKTGAANRTSKLEERLNDLVELIRLQQQGNGASAQALGSRIDPALGMSDHTGPVNGLHKPATTLSPPRVQDAAYPTPSTNAALTHASVSSNPSPDPARVECEDGLSPLEKEEMLNHFRTEYLGFFPFMWIKPEVTAEDIERSRPFLWLNIRAVCEKRVPKMHELGNRIRDELARRVLVELERDQEVILGLLIYLGWATYQTRGKGFQVRYANLANSLVQDLRLDQPFVVNNNNACWFPHHKIPPTPQQTNEQRRIVVATFVLCSTVSNFLRVDITRWNNHMEECLQKLGAEPEYPGDELLVAIAKVKLIDEEIGRVSWKRPNYESSGPPYLFLKPLQEKLDDFKRSLTPSLAENRVLLSHLHNTEVLLYEMVICYPSAPVIPAFSSNQYPSSLPVPPMNILPASASDGTSKGLGALLRPIDVPRLELLHSCLAAVQRSLGNFFTFAPGEYVAFPFAVMCHLSHSVQMLYRLSTLDAPGWDRAAVRRAADLLGVLHEIGERLGRVAAAAGLVHGADASLGCSVDIFTRAVGTMRSTSMMWAAALAQSDNASGGGGGGGSGGGGSSSSSSGGGSGGAGVGAGISDGSVTDATLTSATPLAMEGVTCGGGDITDSDNMQALLEFEADPWLTDLFASWEG